MPTVQDIAEAIVAREGGYVNDPDDPGGPTNHGVTLATMQAYGRDLTGDGRITARDVQALGRREAARIFVDHYYIAPRINLLPEPLQASVFDMYVNSGVHAVRILQRLFNEMRIVVAVDGVIGPATAAAATQAIEAAPDHLVDAYGIARRNYYYALADVRPTSRKFARTRSGGKGGWILRAEEFIAPRFHLTDSQHRERTAQWD